MEARTACQLPAKWPRGPPASASNLTPTLWQMRPRVSVSLALQPALPSAGNRASPSAQARRVMSTAPCGGPPGAAEMATATGPEYAGLVPAWQGQPAKACNFAPSSGIQLNSPSRPPDQPVCRAPATDKVIPASNLHEVLV